MPDKPIIFSAPMIRALFDGRKTLDRRVLKPWAGEQSKWLTMQTLHAAPTCYLAEVNGNLGVQMQHPLAGTTQPYGQVDAMSPLTWVRLPYAPGHRLWVKEAWRAERAWDNAPPRDLFAADPVLFEADGEWSEPVSLSSGFVAGRLRSPIHMPSWASRMTLGVTEVRVQRLQEITEADAKAEGIEVVRHHNPKWVALTPENLFAVFWNSLHGNPKPVRGEGGISHYVSFPWDGRSRTEAYRGKPHIITANPWVACLSFETHQKNIDQMER